MSIISRFPLKKMSPMFKLSKYSQMRLKRQFQQHVLEMIMLQSLSSVDVGSQTHTHRTNDISLLL